MTTLFDKILATLSPPVEVSEEGIVDGMTFACELSRIFVDYDWNARRGNWRADLDEIERSMLPDGDSGPIRQDLPGVVRRHVPTEKDPQEYQLVSGFSRYTVLERIAKRLELENPTMVVIFHNLDEADALEQNIRENVGRNQQRMVDTAFQLYNAWRTRGVDNSLWLNPIDIAPRVAMNPGLVAVLLRIMRNGEKDMLEAWRKCQISVDYVEIDKIVAKYPKMEHLKQFKLLLNNIDSLKNEKTALGVTTAGLRTIHRSRTFGTLLRELERVHCITVNADNLESVADDVSLALKAHFGGKMDTLKIVREILVGYRLSVDSSRSEEDGVENG